MKKIWIFRSIALLIPIILLLFLEVGLRVLGYGVQYPLFIENPDAPQYLLPRPDIVKRYFPKGSEIPSVTIETNFFRKQKPKNGIRIFVQGGSTAAGFPFGYGASLAGMLDYRLKKTFPDRAVEVINTSLAAVNSFTMLDFSDEIIQQKPDAILIYAGHNEFLGILGIGSAYTAANSYTATKLFLRLKEFRLFQLIQNLYSSIQTSDVDLKQNHQRSRTFMAKVAKQKKIYRDSELFQLGLDQFRNNLIQLIEKYKDAGIPVYISTIASNIKHQKPFASSEIPQLVKENYSELFAAIKQKNVSPKQATQVEQLANQYQNAELYYFLGNYYSSNNDFRKAKQFYVDAKDNDLLRFRAPTEINSIIVELSKKFGINLVDAHLALEKRSPAGIIGNNLMLEHLHPNLVGYFTIADSFYNSLRQTKILGDFPRVISKIEAESDIPVFPAEEYWGKAKISALIADYPFTNQPKKPNFPPILSWDDQLGFAAYKKKSSWLDIAIKTLKRSSDDPKMLIKAAKLLAEALPHRADYNFQAGVLLIQHQSAIEAPRYLLRAIEIEENNVNYQLALAHAYSKMKRFDEALKWLHSILKLDPNNKTALSAIRQIEKFSPHTL